MVNTILANKDTIKASGNDTAQQLVDQLQWTKDGVGIVSDILFGAAGGVIAGKIAKAEKPEIHNSKSDNNGTVDTTYSGDVYSPDFKGPVEWDYYYRGDATKRDTFESSMTQSKGSQAVNDELNNMTDG
ncbi:MAG: hypothetical protein E7I55_15865 [Acinetobacter ursingii]|nr:hypothetical protein [Acinetobacter ursingii]